MIYKMSQRINAVTIILLGAMVWNSCSKAPTGPPLKTDDNESYVYIELDGIKHLFTNKENNRNKKTAAGFLNNGNHVLAGVLYIGSEFYRPASESYENIKISIVMPYKPGRNEVSTIYFSSSSINQGKSYDQFQLSFNQDNRNNNNTIDSIAYIERIDSVNQLVKIRYEGTFIEGNSITAHHIKVISEFKKIFF
jgi:hypothetical protein